ncbi:MAG: T9SS type A sorting domain-containing protein, partial [Paludibacteraceae bacterium]|nr:T9SS type A sorting domain-containing protein [Paludibacteraceae bacterium]
TYDLTEEQPIFNGIPTGDYEGRFFLNIGGMMDPTNVEEIKESVADDRDSASISIFANHNKITVSASPDSKLEAIFVSDMSGRSWSLQPNGSNYSEHYLPMAAGVYTVKVVSDKMIEVKKVIIK